MLRSVHRNFSADAFDSIYAYNKYRDDAFGHNEWQCLGQMDSAEQALQRAKQLFQSEKFAKIEIKKKFFDMKKNRHLVSTFQVLERKKIQQKIFLSCFGVLILAIFGFLILENL